jgi:hypothetical protein
VILYAQFSLFLDACTNIPTEEVTLCDQRMAPYNLWLDIEVLSFYLQIALVALFAAHFMINSEF